MSDKYHSGVKAGQTSVSIVIRLLSTAGAAVTGKVYSDLTAYYWRQGGSPSAISLSALAAINSAYSSGGVKEADATNMPGLYRLDLPDAMLATGADWVALAVKCTGAMDYEVFLPLESVGDAETYARVGAPTGASVSADIAAVQSDTDNIQARLPAALVSGRMDSNMQAAANGVITAAVIAADALDADALATDAVTEIWAATTRTLTQAVSNEETTTSAGLVTRYRGATWTLALTGLGSLTGYSKLWLTVKSDPDDADAGALLQVAKHASGSGDGLLVLNGSASGLTAGDGAIVIDVAATGDITLTVKPATTTQLEPQNNLAWDVKMLTGAGVVSVLATGTLNILADITRKVS